MNPSVIIAAIGHRWGSRLGGSLPPSNQAPTVSAGNQSVSTGGAVSITATASDPDGTIASYLWTKISGTASPTLSGTTTATLSFTAPGSADTLVYRCTVTDNLGVTASVDVTITVSVSGSFTDIPVTPTGVASMTVSWTLPTTNADGTALSPTPTAQRLKVALSSQFFGTYPFVYYVNDFTSTSKTIPSLVSGTTYYMVHETYANGQWSESSPEFSKAA